MLNIQNYTKRFGDKIAVDDLSLHIAAGEICAFIGHNGAGKTTTLKACCGLLKPDGGTITVNGIDIQKDPIACKKIMAYIPDNPDLYEFLTGYEYLNFVADMYGVSEADRKAHMEALAERLDIKNALPNLISECSHGMKQKIAVIGAAPLASGAVFEEFDPKEHYVICADAGYDTAVQYGVRPDLVIGDFDSAAKRPPETIRTIKLPVEKDVTDMMGAVMVGQKLGYKTFVLIGGLGGDRFDHSMANLDVLLYISKHGGSAVLCTEDTKVFVVRCGRIVLTELKGATVSVFPFDGSSCNLTYEGLQYPLEKKDLTAGSSLMGVSNCIISDRAEIRVNIGCALVIVYTPKDMPAEPPQSEIQSRLPETEDKKDTEK